MSEPVIRVEDLHKSYDAVEALRGVSFEVNAGEVFGLLGPNGAGKTSTIEILEGLRARAMDGPREAPEHVEERLRTAFRRQSRRRNLVTWVPSLSVAAAAVIALLLWIHNERPKSVAAPAAVTAQRAV